MQTTSLLRMTPGQWRRRLALTLSSWWAMTMLGAMAVVMALSPTTYTRSNRAAISRYIYLGTWQVLPWFTLMAALVSLVLIRIVVVTALSYGLSQYALEMMVRVLVLELIPLAAAMFVALRAALAYTIAHSGQGAASLAQHPAEFDQHRLRTDLVPQVIANAFAVLSLAIVNSVIALVLAYVSVYGLSPWGLEGFTRTVGRVFEPEVAAGFGFKTILFGLAVAVIPAAAIMERRRTGRGIDVAVQPGAVRLLLVLVLIEAGSLVVKYI